MVISPCSAIVIVAIREAGRSRPAKCASYVPLLECDRAAISAAPTTSSSGVLLVVRAVPVVMKGSIPLRSVALPTARRAISVARKLFGRMPMVRPHGAGSFSGCPCRAAGGRSHRDAFQKES